MSFTTLKSKPLKTQGKDLQELAICSEAWSSESTGVEVDEKDLGRIDFSITSVGIGTARIRTTVAHDGDDCINEAETCGGRVRERGPDALNGNRGIVVSGRSIGCLSNVIVSHCA
jgi:hypothetical protein